MIDHTVVSQSFHNAGRWIVHAPGPNRNPKIAYFDMREEAEECSRRINAFVDEKLRKAGITDQSPRSHSPADLPEMNFFE